MKFPISVLLTVFLFQVASAQIPVQNIRGRVIDKDSKVEIQGAVVKLTSTTPPKGAITDMYGDFLIADVPVGRHSLSISFLGYEPFEINEFELNSGKEVVFDIELIEKVVGYSPVIITAKADKDKPINELTTVSARQFSVEETQRYAAALNDPGRMASSFAGVVASPDGRNDIIIRGNSPGGLLWRMQGVDIPNPNHFSNAGSSGGGIAMVSNYLLTNSDFMTGAFPAEYGNALSGVFDLKLRRGNKAEREFRLGVGVLGIDFAGEGPIQKGRSSYLANYRYSTLSFLNALDLPVLSGALYNYQDLSFHLNFDTKKIGKIGVFGMGGFSSQKFKVGGSPMVWENRSDRTQKRFGSGMGAGGVTHIHLFKDNKTFLRTVVSASVNSNYENEDTLNDVLAPANLVNYRFTQGKYTLSSVLSHKIDAQHLVKLGFYLNHLFFNLQSSQLNFATGEKVTQVAGEGSALLGQPFFHWRYRINDKITVNAGLHGMLFGLNGKWIAEPRLGLRWNFLRNHAIGLGFGQHSQVLPIGTYFATQTNPQTQKLSQANKNLDFIKAQHYVLAYDWKIFTDFRIKMEAYYQRLYSVPVGISNPALSTINTSWNFETDSLINKGTGRNYGVELTIEKFFSKNYYFLLTGSVYNSKYTGSDNIERNTRYNGNYAFNFLGGKEFYFGKKNHYLELNARIIWLGGQRYLPIDLDESRIQQQTVYDYSDPFTLRQKDYFRADGRVAIHLNQKKVAHIVSFDMQNMFNTKNDFIQYYDVEEDEIKNFYQSGLVPIFAYRIDF